MTEINTDKEILALKEEVRKAHETIQELRGLIREAEAKKKDVIAVVNVSSQAMVEHAVKRNLKVLAEETEKAIEEVSAKINKRFDYFADVLLGEDKKTKRQGKPSLTEMAAARKLLIEGKSDYSRNS